MASSKGSILNGSFFPFFWGSDKKFVQIEFEWRHEA